MTGDQAAREFQKRLAAGLADRATNADFARIGEFLRSLTRPDEAQACLRRYLDVYAKHENERNRSRSDAAFYLVLNRVLELAKPAELDTWTDALSARPATPLAERFAALGKTDAADRDRIVAILDAPKQARKQSATVLGELRDAFHRARGRDARDLAELADFDPLNDPGLVRDYRDRVAKLAQAYENAKRPRDRAPMDALRLEVDATWAWVLGQRRDGLRLFQLLRVWRADRGDAHLHHPSSYAEEVAYVQIAAALLGYAVSTKAYAGNVRARGFTDEEWTFVFAPLERLEYASTYRSQLKRFFEDVPSFPRQCELFLRLLAFARSTGSWLATDEEMRTVTGRLEELSPAELRRPVFTIDGQVVSRWYTKGDYRIGRQIGTRLVIVDYQEKPQRRVYVEFAGMRGTLFAVPFSRFAGYAEDAPYELVYEATKGLLVLIPLLFEVLVAIPMVVEGGFVGLIQALLQPAEEKVAGEVLDAIGVDPDKAGWLVMGANLLLAHKVGELGKPKVRFDELEASEGRFGRAIERPGTQSPGTTARGVDPPPEPVPPARGTGKPLDTEVRAIEASEVPDRELVKALERPQRGDAQMMKAAERDADKSAAKASRTRRQQKQRKAVGDESDVDPGKRKASPKRDARGTGNRAKSSRGVPPPPPPPPPVTPSPLGYLSVNVERSAAFAELRRAGWTITSEPIAGSGKGLWAWWQRQVSGVEHEWKLVSPGGVEVTLDGLALESQAGRRLNILEAKAGYTDIVEDSAHFRFSDSKVVQLTRQLSAALESNGVIDKVIVVCNRRAAAETYQNIAQNLVAELKRNFAPQLRAWLASETTAPVRRLLTKDVERFVEEHFDVVWQ